MGQAAVLIYCCFPQELSGVVILVTYKVRGYSNVRPTKKRKVIDMSEPLGPEDYELGKPVAPEDNVADPELEKLLRGDYIDDPSVTWDIGTKEEKEVPKKPVAKKPKKKKTASKKKKEKR